MLDMGHPVNLMFLIIKSNESNFNIQNNWTIFDLDWFQEFKVE